MKKILSIIFAVCLAASLITVVPVSAASNEVLVGTPVVDGYVDDIYKQSLAIVIDGDPAKNESGTDWWDATGNFYALYDSLYVYIVAEVKDDDVVSAADKYVLRDFNPYKNDCVEFRLDFNDGGLGSYTENPSFFKVGIDAFGKRVYTLASEVFDVNTCVYKTRITEDGYVIEAAIPHSTHDKNQLLKVGKLGFKVWLYDLNAEAEGLSWPEENLDYVHYGMNFGKEAFDGAYHWPLSNKKVVGGATPTPDTTAAPETTVAPETTAAPETTEAPETTVAPDTTEAIDTTAEVGEVTTVAAEDTTANAEDTTAEAEDTTAKAEDTTAEAEDTTAEAEDTTAAPETTKPADTDDEGGINPIAIVGIAAAVVVIAAAAVIIAKKKKA